MSKIDEIFKQIYRYLDDDEWNSQITKRQVQQLEKELSEDSQWIDVNDSLPDTVRSVLIYDGRIIAFAFFNSDKKWVDFGNRSFYEDVIFWRELPKPPIKKAMK